MKLNFYIISIIILIILILIELNTPYKIINNIPNLILNKSGVLYIGTHDYEHKDILVTFRYLQNFNKNFIMLFADKPWNYMLESLRPKNIEFLYVKGKTVETISSKLLLGHNVFMFFYKESESSGPYYIIKNTNCKTCIFQIKNLGNNLETDQNNNKKTINHYSNSINDIYFKNFMCKFSINFKTLKYNNYLLENKDIFINYIKKKLYYD